MPMKNATDNCPDNCDANPDPDDIRWEPPRYVTRVEFISANNLRRLETKVNTFLHRISTHHLDNSVTVQPNGGPMLGFTAVITWREPRSERNG